MKSVPIQSFSGPYSVGMREYTDQKNSEYRHFSRSESEDLSHDTNNKSLVTVKIPSLFLNFWSLRETYTVWFSRPKISAMSLKFTKR